MYPEHTDAIPTTYLQTTWVERVNKIVMVIMLGKIMEKIFTNTNTNIIIHAWWIINRNSFSNTFIRTLQHYPSCMQYTP